MKKIDIYITDYQSSTLKNISSTTGLSMSEHIRRAIDEYLDKIKSQPNITNNSNHNPVEIAG